jgi:hypothetical protein
VLYSLRERVNRKEALREGAEWAIDKTKTTWENVLLYYRCLFFKFSPNKDFYTSMLFIRT